LPNYTIDVAPCFVSPANQPLFCILYNNELRHSTTLKNKYSIAMHSGAYLITVIREIDFMKDLCCLVLNKNNYKN
jgi:hypothetical protein